MKLAAILTLVATSLAIPAPHRFGGGGFNPNTISPSTTSTVNPSNPGATNPSTSSTGTIDPSLVPAFGIQAGVPSASQPGSCQGANDINIPCQCPPSTDAFIQRLQQFAAAGNAFGIPITFSTDVSDMSVQTQLNRINACINTLQNFDDTTKGAGCPAASAPNFSAVQASLERQL